METVKKQKKKLSKSALVLIISCAIIAIPVIVFLVIILSSVIGTGKPVFGQRFKNDLNPEITKANQSAIVANVKSLSNVDDCTIELPSAQLRINVDAKDTITKDETEKLAKDVYNVVAKELPISTYFTISSNGLKMYDLEINVYNYIPTSTDDNSWISYIVTKNSKMDKESYQLISEPLVPDLAKELRGELTSDTTDTSNAE